MDDAKFDRLARAFAETLTRRRTVLLLSGTSAMLGQEAARGFQLGPATCGEEGAVCTLVSACCDGLTCVTSAINTSYGICVPGDGGMVSTGTTLISPFSETAVEELRILMQTPSTTPAPDPEADRQARAAEIRARKKTRRAARKTRFDTKRATMRTRKDEKRNGQRKARDADEAAGGPQLELKLVFAEADPDSGVDGDQPVPIEVVRVMNRDDVDVVLTRIETLKGPVNEANLVGSKFTLDPGASYSLVSGLPSEDIENATKDRHQWLDKVMCDGTIQKQGYRVTAAFSRGRATYEFVVFCHKPRVTGAIETPAAAQPRKRKQTDEQKQNRSSQHEKKKKR
jgi:hypothetical protein